MKNAILFLSCLILLCGCATKKPASKVSKQDLEMFRKTFEGTLLSKKFEPYTREEPVMGLPFWTKPITAYYFQITVMDKNGKVRKFYEYSEEKNRKAELQQYNNELANGDAVIVDLGYIDEGHPEELFDFITKKSY
jgi:hypothetical protein